MDWQWPYCFDWLIKLAWNSVNCRVVGHSGSVSLSLLTYRGCIDINWCYMVILIAMKTCWSCDEYFIRIDMRMRISQQSLCVAHGYERCRVLREILPEPWLLLGALQCRLMPLLKLKPLTATTENNYCYTRCIAFLFQGIVKCFQ